MINDTTDHLKLPLPHKDNYLEDDVPRLRDALIAMDEYARDTDADLQALRSEKADSATMQEALSQKADMAAMQTALAKKADKSELVKLNNTVTSTSTTEAATANAAKLAYDRGTAGINAAGAAHGAANAAQTTANEAKNITNLVRTAPAAWCVPQAGADGKINAGWIGGGGTLPIGFPAFLAWRYNQLPPGWYFMNGTRYVNGSPQANALNALSAEFKADWGITNNGATTNVPNWFHTDGRGPTMRAVNGSSRQVGSVEDGAIQNITGGFQSVGGAAETANGAFAGNGYDSSLSNVNSGGGEGRAKFKFDASRVVRTAPEVLMLNRGMTPAIFLGV